VHLGDLAPFLLGKAAKTGRFFVLGFCMDDSADGKRAVVFSVAGFLGQTAPWFELERLWEARLKRDGIAYFRMTEYINWQGEFRKLADKYGLTTARVIADALVRDLKQLIRDTPTLGGFSLGVLMPDFRQVISELKRVPFDKDPYVFAHQQLIGLMAEKVHESKHPDIVACTYDEHSKAKELQNSWVDFKEANPTVAQYLGTLAPLDDKVNASIQIADLLAHTTTAAFVSRHKDPAAGIAELQEWLPSLVAVAYVNREYLRALLAFNARKKRSK
jgi:hypothetical protein